MTNIHIPVTANAQEQHGAQLFLVRVWNEGEEEGQAAWRGKVQHVISGKARRFDDFTMLVSLLVSMVADNNSSSPGNSGTQVFTGGVALLGT